jgi:hypothetical protein
MRHLCSNKEGWGDFDTPECNSSETKGFYISEENGAESWEEEGLRCT